MDQGVKSQGIKAAEIQARWGIPNWTRAEDYPIEMTDRAWRWEFLRRNPVYRRDWEALEARGLTVRILGEPGFIEVASFTDDTNWHMYFNPKCHLTDNILDLLEAVNVDVNYVVSRDRKPTPRLPLNNPKFVEYQFNIAEPLGPQIRKAQSDLLQAQEVLSGRKSTPRPSRELWSLYLRLLDARECDASWRTIGRTLYGSDTACQKARRTFDCAVVVRDNFPI